MAAPRHARARLTEGPVEPTLIKMASSMLLGIASVVLFNLADTFYIGQLGSTELAAISFTFPITMLVISLAMGLSVGTSAIVSRAIGAGDHNRVQRLTTDCLALALILVVSLSLLGFFTIDPVFSLLGAPAEQIQRIREYMEIWYLGIGLVVIPMVGNSAIRATGDTKTPSRVMMLAAVINIILDPFLIFGIGPFPRLELQGAAIATLIAYSVTFLFALWVLGYRERMLTLAIPALEQLQQNWLRLTKVAVPAATTNMLTPLTAAVLTHLVAQFGSPAVAAFGVGTRIESMAMIGVMALASVLTPFIGQNWGAKKVDRIQRSMSFALRVGMLWGGSACLILALLAIPLARLFADEAAIVELASHYLWIIPCSYAGLALVTLGSAIFNAFHQPKQAAQLVLIRLLLLTIPLAYLGAYLSQLEGIFAGIALANLLAGSYAWRALKFKQQSIANAQTEATAETAR
ncbi:MAG: MATE family efflux transporter [Motiliproteus sp.]|nr:MATE family efflux transporter [Motiliproteus sp.]MCW9052397.1 MATE family efflux transporter [Motiliproteus sp.]